MDARLDMQRLDDAGPCDPGLPFPFFVMEGMLPRDACCAAMLARDFPAYRSAGFFPYADEDCGPSVRHLVRQMTSREFGDAVGRRLGLDELGSRPTLATLCRSLNLRHGTIHTDSRSKIATALVYLNASWPDTSGGCLRFLRTIDDIDALASSEVRPIYGTLVAFRRADNSFHGHLPFEGERRVIQVAWLTSEDEKARKTRRGRFSRALKRLLGALDRRLGAKRDRNAAHPD
jgi:hypothetical protein